MKSFQNYFVLSLFLVFEILGARSALSAEELFSQNWIVNDKYIVTQNIVANGKTPDQVETSDPSQKNKKDRLEWSGNFKFGLLFAQNRSQLTSNQLGFELSDVNFKIKFRIKKRMQLRLKYQITPSESELKEAFIHFTDKNAILSRGRIGLQRRFFALESDLETDSLNKIAIYDLRDVGLQFQIRFLKQWRWEIGLANGGKLDKKNISPRRVKNQDIILVDSFDKEQSLSSISRREVSTGIGFSIKDSTTEEKIIDTLFFGSVSTIIDEDIESIETKEDLPGFTGFNDGSSQDNIKLGFNITLHRGRLRSYTQYAFVIFKALERQLFSTEWSVRFKKWQPILAYSQQTLNIDPDPIFPLSWERRRYTSGLRYQWSKPIYFSLEATFNDEETGGGKITNNQVLWRWIYEF